MKTDIKKIAIICAVLFNSICYGQSPSTVSSVKIGTQEWAARNLSVAKFANGNAIPEAKTAVEWENANKSKKPAWCYYKNNPANGAKYGRIYNWYAVNDLRGLAPKGWHIPSNAEWGVTIQFLGGNTFAGLKMKSISGWDANGNGNNESGIEGLPGGERNPDGSFTNLGVDGCWWSTTPGTDGRADFAWACFLSNETKEVYNLDYDQTYGFYVRCLKGSDKENPMASGLSQTGDKTSSKTPETNQKKESKISGFVQYYESAYVQKPDVGATVLILLGSYVKDFKQATVDSFNYIKTYQNYDLKFADEGQTTPESVTDKLKAYGVETEEKFTALDMRNFKELEKIKHMIYYCKQVIIDETGKFSVVVPAGTYYVYTTSKNSHRSSVTEVLGKISCVMIKVKENETSIANTDFELY